MPPRDPELPEGTDHIIQGAAGSSNGGGSRSVGGTGTGATGGGASSGFVASSGGNDTGGTTSRDGGGGTDKLVGQVREQVSSLRGQATDKIRGLADGGKDRATDLLDNFGEVINDAARSIDERLGSEYGSYAHRAADAVASTAERLRGKSVDDLLDDTRSLVRGSPGIAIGIAAIAGFALMRVIKTGLEDTGVSRSRSGGSAGGGRSKRGSTGSDATAGGGA